MSKWEECAQKLDIWRAILAWAQSKREDIGKEHVYRRVEKMVLETILRNIESFGKSSCERNSLMDPSDVEQSIMQAIEQEYACLCHYARFHTDGDGQMVRCCIRKQLFEEMLGKLPKHPPVRKWSEYRGFEN
jgi:hypothetical protein